MSILKRAEQAVADTKTSINAAVVIGIVALVVGVVALVLAVRK
jgi:hypothetical protein